MPMNAVAQGGQERASYPWIWSFSQLSCPRAVCALNSCALSPAPGLMSSFMARVPLFLHSIPPYHTGSRTEPGWSSQTQLGWLTSESRDPPVSPSPGLESQAGTTIPGCLHGFWRLQLGSLLPDRLHHLLSPPWVFS